MAVNRNWGVEKKMKFHFSFLPSSFSLFVAFLYIHVQGCDEAQYPFHATCADCHPKKTSAFPTLWHMELKQNQG